MRTFVFGQQNDGKDFSIDCAWFLVAHFIAARGWAMPFLRRLPAWAFSALLGATTALALAFVPAKYEAFIYFQF